MSEVSRPNFFIILEIDPNKPWSKTDAEFKEILKNKRAEWTKKSKNPKNAALYTSYMRLVPKIEEVMGNEENRQKEAKEALKEKSVADRELRDKSLEDLKLITSKGFITEEQIIDLAKQYHQVITEAGIREELKKRGIDVRNKAAEAKTVEDVLDASQMKEIKNLLEFLKKKDLYDFLGATSSPGTSALKERAELICNENRKYGEKTPEITASSELSGYALTIFKDDESRARYDRSVERSQYEILGESVATIVRSEKRIYANQFRELLEKARSKGLDIDRAKEYIIERAAKMGAAVEISGVEAEALKKKLRCTNCESINEPNREFCSQCSAQLKVTCPSCSQVSPVEDRACSKCSFPIGNAFNVRSLIDDAKEQLSRQLYENAVIYLKLASEQWSTIPPREVKDQLTKEIRQYLEEAEGYQRQEKNLTQQLTSAMDSRRFYEARKILRQIEAEFGARSLTKEKTTIDAAIQKAELELHKAREVEARGGDAVELLQNILWSCKDCLPALESLAKSPPAPPTELSASVGDKVVSLSWHSSPAKNLRYTIVRKYRSRPISGNDGERLQTISGTTYDDTTSAIGIPVYYAVYANREDVLSASAAELKAPVLLVGDVANVVKQVANQQVSISWEVPENATEVCVFRSTNRQGNPQNGDRIQVLNNSKIVDRQLQNGKTYYYTIYTIFTDRQGKAVTSSGVVIEAIPEEPPAIVENLQIEVKSTSPTRELKLSWTVPPKGEVAVLLSNTLPPFTVGAVLPEKTVASQGKLLQSEHNQVIATIQEIGIVYFTPIVLFQNTAYVGETVEYTSIDDVSNLKVQKQKTELQVRWDWPKKCQQVVVAYSHSNFPTLSSSGAIRDTVAKAQYDLHGYYAIKNPVQKDYYIVVHSVLVQNGQTVMASGLSKSARFRVSLASSLNLQYEIKRNPKLFGVLGNNKLILSIKITGTGEMPALILVRKQGSPPLKKDDGDVILNIPGFQVTPKTATPSFEISDRPRSYGKLFLVDDDLYEAKGGYVRIEHPEQKKMETYI